MIHNLLPNQARLYRMGIVATPNCEFCPDDTPDTLTHSLLTCPQVSAPGSFLLSVLKFEIPNIRPEQVVLLDFNVNENLPLVYLSASVLSQVWTSKKEKKSCNLHSIRATLEAGIQILRKSRFQNSAIKLQAMIEKCL